MNDKVEKYWHLAFITAAFIVSIYLRVIRPWHAVFQWTTLLGGNDPWYYYRLIMNCLHNFPNRIWFDAFTYYPYGTYVHFGPFLVYTSALASIIMGAHTPEQVRTVIAFIPTIGGTLLALPVYLFAREVFGKKTAAFASFLVVVVPGQLLARSILGFNDHHIWEVFWMLSSLSLYALSLNVWSGRSALENVKSNRVIIPVLAGLTFGGYLDTWAPGFILAPMITVYVFSLYLGWKFFEEKENSAISGAIMFATAALVYLPFAFKYPGLDTVHYSPFQLIVVLGFSFILVAFYLLEQFQKIKNLPEYTVPATVVAVTLAMAGLAFLSNPRFIHDLLGVIGVIHPRGGALTIAEVQPFFTMGGQFSLIPAWLNFGITFFFAIPGYMYLLYLLYRDKKNLYLLMLVWSTVMFVALCGQNRFAYYFGAVTAILSAVFLVFLLKVYALYYTERKTTRLYAVTALWVLALLILRLNMNKFPFALIVAFPAALDALLNINKELSLSSEFFKELREGLDSKKQTLAVVTIVALLSSSLFVIAPTLGESYAQSQYAGGINHQWYNALTWMRNNTPYRSFYDKYFYEIYKPGYKPNHKKPYPYPHPTYGIMSWWDYGHWIEAIAHRMPIANPFQEGIGNKYRNAPGAAPFFTAFNESYADSIADKLNVKYVISDVEMATGKFYAMAVWAEGSLAKAGMTYYSGVGYLYTYGGRVGLAINPSSLPAGSRIISAIQIPSENYYKTMEARLHIMDGCGLKHYRMVYESKPVSANSMMGIEEMIYRSIFDNTYASKLGLPKVNVTTTGFVKIFEYVKGAKVEGTAPPGVKYVTAETTVKTNQGRTFVYVQKCKVVNGHYQLILPYAQNTTYPVKPSPYIIKAGKTEESITLSDKDVEQGRTIVLNLT
jgi:dolichyl-diphosphooligosaccharide--protein glycosyltransferase